MRFLAVDDEPLFLQLLETRMQGLGYPDLTKVKSGAEALTLLGVDRGFDCLLLDIRMPEMDGITLCRKIRALDGYGATPIVMVTSMSDRSYIDDAFAAGATDYITKPLERIEIKARLGMIAQWDAQTKMLKASQMQSPLSSYEIEPNYNFEDPITLPNVDRLISYMAMENYLLTLGLKTTTTLRAFAVHIENARSFYAHPKRAAFVDMIGDVATVVLESLKADNVVFSYAGGGTFVCIVRGEMQEDIEDVEVATNLYMTGFEEFYADENLPNPIIHFGSVVKISGFSLSRPTRLPELAIAAVENAVFKSSRPRGKLQVI
ncbi:MAG: response regulator [bacterium]